MSLQDPTIPFLIVIFFFHAAVWGHETYNLILTEVIHTAKQNHRRCCDHRGQIPPLVGLVEHHKPKLIQQTAIENPALQFLLEMQSHLFSSCSSSTVVADPTEYVYANLNMSAPMKQADLSSQMLFPKGW